MRCCGWIACVPSAIRGEMASRPSGRSSEAPTFHVAHDGETPSSLAKVFHVVPCGETPGQPRR
jgi:hypothetical protein